MKLKRRLVDIDELLKRIKNFPDNIENKCFNQADLIAIKKISELCYTEIREDKNV
jgi:hypothetical protein